MKNNLVKKAFLFVCGFAGFIFVVLIMVINLETSKIHKSMFTDFFAEYRNEKARGEQIIATATGAFIANFMAWSLSNESDAIAARKVTEDFTIVWTDETVDESNTLETIKKEETYLSNEELFTRGKSNHIWVKRSMNYLDATPISIERAIRTSNEHAIELKSSAKKQQADSAASRQRKLQNLLEEMRTASPERIAEIQAEVQELFQK